MLVEGRGLHNNNLSEDTLSVLRDRRNNGNKIREYKVPLFIANYTKLGRKKTQTLDLGLSLKVTEVCLTLDNYNSTKPRKYKQLLWGLNNLTSSNLKGKLEIKFRNIMIKIKKQYEML